MLKKMWVLIKSPGLMAIVALLGFGFGIYGTFFYEKRPGLTLDVASNSTVFDVHTNVSKLDISYSGEDLRKSNETLRVITLSVVNSGKTDIVKRDYDDAEPLGFYVKGGKILEVSRISGSNDYLKRNLQVFLNKKNEVSIAPIILESGEFIDVQVLVLAPINASIGVSPLGKIAGIRQIAVVEPNQNGNERPIWQRVTNADSFWIHFLRAPLYFILFLFESICVALIIVVIITPILNISTYFKRRHRNSEISSYSTGRTLSNDDRLILDYYRKNGKGGLIHLSFLLDRLFERNSLIEKLENCIEKTEIKNILANLYGVSSREIFALVNTQVLVEQDLKIMPAANFSRSLNDILKAFEVDMEEAKKDRSLDISPYGPIINWFFEMPDENVSQRGTVSERMSAAAFSPVIEATYDSIK
ncbi:hypothetical protein ACIPF8_10835 [Collimonas sp. NPDC087041]|uniref:hypothetical protein n=1 Tax=Collimonas sp. NPDC087041 TaxID=3363960 RepID=UPI0037F8BA93